MSGLFKMRGLRSPLYAKWGRHIKLAQCRTLGTISRHSRSSQPLLRLRSEANPPKYQQPWPQLQQCMRKKQHWQQPGTQNQCTHASSSSECMQPGIWHGPAPRQQECRSACLAFLTEAAAMQEGRVDRGLELLSLWRQLLQRVSRAV